jgi:diamine N-acetyltransferase
VTLPHGLALRRATPDDATVLGVLATQVFLDTYATQGIDRELAAEARSVYAPEVFAGRLQRPDVQITLATAGGGTHVVGFADLDFGSPAPLPGLGGAELFRLYVQRPFQRHGVGRRLLAAAEGAAAARGAAQLWLTAWAGNTRALAFYRALGYADIGRTEYVIEGRAFENRVLARPLGAPPADG